MKVDVLLFAQLADAVGARSLSVDMADGATVDDVMTRLAETHEPIRVMRETIAVALDERYVGEGTRVRDGCTLALIPPVSGG
ncbi:MAG: MoaD/ThiS family protein [Phycisphaerales bacterium]|nr:MoaD/ThiS family protein [Phycisphaerae bacterium]NNF44235.1 MoaD/ThiS family protein [Phycisphaerales bacterium]NNM26094.1 MoaD/ThiS family protein [Phycisphaerales bacterium]